ncbi:DUF4145 domain-containing protein [Xanthomonas arboricola]|uniref:DUF4145 domain-containing protein n=1 Tax=Xanthomonas arboricola TaxID=56448 RepID=UPI0012687EF2|nr:DUF4145 domain-containing protein [Xanthomonas arboricola]
MITEREFLHRVDESCAKQLDRALALIWFAGVDDQTRGLTARAIADILRDAGHPGQNVSRLDASLASDKRTAVAKGGGWALRPAARRDLDESYRVHLGPGALPESDSVVPMSLVAGTRGYIEKVAGQINKSFDGQLYDCCAVMCRKLLETLIIEVYEKEGRGNEIRDGRHIVGLAELITTLDKDQSIFVSRPAMNALKAFKVLGDLSAHNRHYNARIGDIEPQRAGIRLIVEELLYRSGLNSVTPAAA